MSPRQKGPRTFTANSPGRENPSIAQDNAKSHQYVKKLEFNGNIKLGKEGLNPPVQAMHVVWRAQWACNLNLLLVACKGKDAGRKAEEPRDCINMNIAKQVFAACKKRVLVLWLADAGDKSQHLICCVLSTTKLHLQPLQLLLLLLFLKRIHRWERLGKCWRMSGKAVAQW